MTLRPVSVLSLCVMVVPCLQAVSWYSHLPIHTETYVRHVHNVIKRSPADNDGNSIRRPAEFRQAIDVDGDLLRQRRDAGDDGASPDGPVKIVVDLTADFEFPYVMTFAFNVDGKNIRLNLRLNRAHVKHTTVKLVRNGKFITYNNTAKKDHAFYQVMDEDVAAAVMVRCENFQFPCYLVGSFTSGGREYMLEPTTHAPKTKSKLHTLHTIYTVPDSDVEDNSDDTDTEELGNNNSDPGSQAGQDGGTRRRRQTSAVNFEVELQMVVDYAIYNYWYTLLQSSSAAVDVIQTYYEQVANSMDLQYSSVTSSSMTVDIVPLEIDIITTPSDQPWIENNRFLSNGEWMVDSSPALDDFMTWVVAQAFTNNFDAAMTFTGEELASISSTGQVYTSTLGRAKQYTYGGIPVSILCRDNTKSVSITEDFRRNRVSRTAAHELGHNMGLYHDLGTECSYIDQYLMASGHGTGVTVDIATNPWTFSPCSIQAMTTNLLNEYWNTAVPRCLSEQSSYNAAAYQSVLAAPRLGEIYSLDEQCARRRGHGSRSCDNFSYYPIDKICYNGLACSPTDGVCNSASIYAVFSGSACDVGKWCDKGLCVAKPTTMPPPTTSTTTTTTTTSITTTTPPTTTPDTSCASQATLDYYSSYYENVYESVFTCRDYTCTASCSSTTTITIDCTYVDISGC